MEVRELLDCVHVVCECMEVHNVTCYNLSYCELMVYNNSNSGLYKSLKWHTVRGYFTCSAFTYVLYTFGKDHINVFNVNYLDNYINN